jgi:hypothetical protein
MRHMQHIIGFKTLIEAYILKTSHVRIAFKLKTKIRRPRLLDKIKRAEYNLLLLTQLLK